MKCFHKFDSRAVGVVLVAVLMLPVLLGAVCAVDCAGMNGMGHSCCLHEAAVRVGCGGCGAALDLAVMSPAQSLGREAAGAARVVMQCLMTRADAARREYVVVAAASWRSSLPAAGFVLRI